MTQDANQQSENGGPTAETHRKRRLAAIVLGCIFLIIGLIWLLYFLIWGQFEVYTDDAYVNGNLIQVMAQVPGTVIDINTDDTYLVMKGDKIIRLDPSDLLFEFQRAQSQLELTIRKTWQVYEEVKRAKAVLISRKADLVKAQEDLKRRLGLQGNHAVSREEMQHYQTAAKMAAAQYQSARHNFRSMVALVANTHLYDHPQVEHAKAMFRIAYLNLQRANVLAPVTGYTAKRSVQIGQRVTVNTPMLAIVPLNDVWVDANYKESQLSDIRIGQPVSLKADAYSDVTYHGKIVGLNAGTGASFSLLPPQNATGNWIKIVQRLPVRISLDPSELKKHPLQLGLSMRVTTDSHDQSGKRLAQLADRNPQYSTDVYTSYTQQTNKLIAKILQANAPNLFYCHHCDKKHGNKERSWKTYHA